MCPENLYELDNNILKLKDDYWKICTLCKDCEENSSNDAIKVGWKDNIYIFSIESDGQHSFDVLIKKTFEIFSEKLDEFTEKLEEIEIQS